MSRCQAAEGFLSRSLALLDPAYLPFRQTLNFRLLQARGHAQSGNCRAMAAVIQGSGGCRRDPEMSGEARGCYSINWPPFTSSVSPTM